MAMQNWLKRGISGAIILEVLLFVVAYWVKREMENFVAGTVDKAPSLASIMGFPPDIFQIIIVLVLGFGLGALVGFLIEKYK